MLDSFLNAFKGGSKTSVGVDIGTSSIKVVEVVTQKNGKALFKNFAIARLKSGSIQTSNQIIAGKMISKILTLTFERSNIKSRVTSFSVPNFSCFLSFVTIPKAYEEELASKLELEARKFIPVSLEEVSLGWEIIENNSQDKGAEVQTKEQKIKVLLMAIAKDTIKKYEVIARDANLNLKSIEAENFALIRCLSQNDRRVILILDIGSRICNILVASEGILRGARNVDVGGGDITDAISRGLGLDLERSEQLKKEGGMTDSRLTDLVMPIVGRISEETKRILEAYNSKNQTRRIERVLVVGGTAKLKGFKEHLSSLLGTSVEEGDPLINLEMSGEQSIVVKQYKDELAVAIGSALNSI